MSTTGSGTKQARSVLETYLASKAYPTAVEFADLLASFTHLDEESDQLSTPKYPEYSATFEYNTGDYTTYNGVIYKSLQDTHTGNQPDTFPAFWEVFDPSPAAASNAEVITGTDNIKMITPLALRDGSGHINLTAGNNAGVDGYNAVFGGGNAGTGDGGSVNLVSGTGANTGAVSVSSGAPTTGNSGAITIGSASAFNATSGNVTIRTGEGRNGIGTIALIAGNRNGLAGVGGHITIDAGNGNSNSGGNITNTTGDPGGNFSSGNYSIIVPAAYDTGDILLQIGAATNAAGAITLSAALNRVLLATQPDGTVDLAVATTKFVLDNAGTLVPASNVEVTTGTENAKTITPLSLRDGSSNFNLDAGGTTGRHFYASAGDNGAGLGGNLYLNSGDGTGGDGGDIYITSGTTTSGSGGLIRLLTGIEAGNNQSGSIELRTAAGYDGGDISLICGAGSNSTGWITLQTAADKARLNAQPTGSNDLAIATTKFVLDNAGGSGAAGFDFVIDVNEATPDNITTFNSFATWKTTFEAGTIGVGRVLVKSGTYNEHFRLGRHADNTGSQAFVDYSGLHFIFDEGAKISGGKQFSIDGSNGFHHVWNTSAWTVTGSKTLTYSSGSQSVGANMDPSGGPTSNYTYLVVYSSSASGAPKGQFLLLPVNYYTHNGSTISQIVLADGADLYALNIGTLNVFALVGGFFSNIFIENLQIDNGGSSYSIIPFQVGLSLNTKVTGSIKDTGLSNRPGGNGNYDGYFYDYDSQVPAWGVFLTYHADLDAETLDIQGVTKGSGSPTDYGRYYFVNYGGGTAKWGTLTNAEINQQPIENNGIMFVKKLVNVKGGRQMMRNTGILKIGSIINSVSVRSFCEAYSAASITEVDAIHLCESANGSGTAGAFFEVKDSRALVKIGIIEDCYVTSSLGVLFYTTVDGTQLQIGYSGNFTVSGSPAAYINGAGSYTSVIISGRGDSSHTTHASFNTNQFAAF
jgi:hypothetical protein